MKIKFEAELDIPKLQKYIEKALHEHKLENGLTIAECVERQTPKKLHHDKDSGLYLCPNCENLKAYDISDFGNYCELCGQALERS